MQLYREAADDDVPDSEVETLMLLSVNLVRGLALDAMIGGGAERRERLLTEWKTTALERYLEAVNRTR